MEVLKLQHINDEYEVIIRSDDVSYSWSRFKALVKPKWNESCFLAERYCKYTSSDRCRLWLYRHKDLISDNIDQPQNEWKEMWPVIFETCDYNIAIRFPKNFIDKGTVPRVRHVRRDVEKCFFKDTDYEGNTIGLSGNVSFLNEPGVFHLEFEYTHNSHVREARMTFEVVSPKLDTKKDYKSLLHDVNEEYNDVIFRYLSTTYQQLARGRVKNDVIWMNLFEGIVADYLKNVERIIHRPHQQVQIRTASAHAESIKQWTPAMEDEYEDKRHNGRLEEHYFKYKEYDATINTRENRFVKYTLTTIGSRLIHILNEVLTKNRNEELSEAHRNDLMSYRNRISKLVRHPFFRTIGKYEGMNQDSMVLQSRMGYQQVYKDWIKLSRGIDLYNGASNIGTLQIWEIYELWCFIKMKRMVKNLLRIDDEHPYYEHLISEPKGSLLNPFADSTMEHVVKFEYPIPDDDDRSEWAEQMRSHRGDVVTLHYQHTFNRRNNDDFGIHTATTEQRPDVVLNIEKKKGEKILLTYLYDAKYRVVSDKRLDRDIEEADLTELAELQGGDYPPSDAINQMHRYRDAIYYGLASKEYSSKEIIGGYILFPGRGDDDTIARRYYSNSIDTVNIGAFPLLPNERQSKEGQQLYMHLENILLRKNISTEHTGKAIPQRGLQYTDNPELALDCKWKHEKVLIFIDTIALHWDRMDNITSVALGLDMVPKSFEIVKEFSKAQYVLITNRNEACKRLYKVKGAPEIVTEVDKEVCLSYACHYLSKNYLTEEELMAKKKKLMVDIYLAFILERPDTPLAFPVIDLKRVEQTVLVDGEAHEPRIVKMEDIIKNV